MSTKQIRQEEILRILRSGKGSTHEEILDRLERKGVKASQSTLSRDLRDLGAIKIHREDGGSYYRLRKTDQGVTGVEFTAAKEEFVTGFQEIGNFMVIKTRPGNARDFCLILDRQEWKEIVGTIAGDDTILVIARSVKDIKLIQRKLKS